MDFKKKFGPVGEGVWVEFDDAKFKLLPPNSRAALLRLCDGVTPSEFLSFTSPEKAAEMQAERTMLETIEFVARQTAAFIIDWEGVQEDGVDVAYSNERAVKLCLEYDDFRSWVDDQVQKLAEVERETAEKLEAIKKK